MARRAAAVATMLLALGSCQVLFVGAFPASAAQMTAQVDLSGSIASSPASSFNLFAVSAAGKDYVILFSSSSFDAAQVHLVVMDEKLRVLARYTSAEISSALATAFSGTFAIADANDNLVVGNAILNPLSTPMFTGPPPAGFSLSGPSFSDLPLANDQNEANFTINSGSFDYFQYDSNWGSQSPDSVPLGGPSSVNLVTAFADPTVAGPDVFVFANYASQQTYFLRIPKLEIRNTLTATLGGNSLFSYYNTSSAPIVTRSGLSQNMLAVSSDGIISYNEDSKSLDRFTLDSPNDVKSMPLKKTEGLKIAAAVSGDYCIVWDPESRALTRYEKWW